MSNKIFLMIIILNVLVSNLLPQTLFRSGLFLHHSVGGVVWFNGTLDVPQLMDMYNTENNYTGNNAVTMNLDEDFFPPVREFSDHYWDSSHDRCSHDRVLSAEWFILSSYYRRFCSLLEYAASLLHSCKSCVSRLVEGLSKRKRKQHRTRPN